MLNSKNIFAYDVGELEKITLLSESKNLFESKVLTQEQWNKTQSVFTTPFYTPSFFMRILLFLFSLVGMNTLIGPFVLLFSGLNFERTGFQIVAFTVGAALMLFTDQILIAQKKHYHSGVTEAGIYAGIILIAFGLLGLTTHPILVYPIVGLFLSLFLAVRYLSLSALLLTLLFVCWFIFQLLMTFGGTAQALIPFVFMAIFSALFVGSKKVQNKYRSIFLNNHYNTIQAISLLLFYLAGNYLVVRELSISMLGLNLSANQNIPFAFVFYAFTVLVPLVYLYWGIQQKSLLIIRIGLLTTALSIFTVKYYYNFAPPEVTITAAGAILIIIALLSFRYLKKDRHGYTCKKLLNDKWSSPDTLAFVASQTLGGNQVEHTKANGIDFGGGSFGGGGASGNW